MTMTNQTDQDLPRSTEELENLAAHYDTTDTADEMDDGQVVDPMRTVSLRLPAGVIDALKVEARQQGMRWTALARQTLEQRVTPDAAADELTLLVQRTVRKEIARLQEQGDSLETSEH